MSWESEDLATLISVSLQIQLTEVLKQVRKLLKITAKNFLRPESFSVGTIFEQDCKKRIL